MMNALIWLSWDKGGCSLTGDDKRNIKIQHGSDATVGKLGIASVARLSIAYVEEVTTDEGRMERRRLEISAAATVVIGQ